MRKIDHIVVHCTATPEGRHVTIAEIDRWHKDRGWKGIGYHKVVYLDGSVHNGRPLSEIGAHTSGHNADSVGVVYVGGVDHQLRPKDTRTPDQKEALEQVLKELVAKYPIKRITGHRDHAAKACPSFDATAEYKRLLEPPKPKPKPHPPEHAGLWDRFRNSWFAKWLTSQLKP